MTTPTPPAVPQCPQLVAMIEQDLAASGVAFIALGDALFEYMAAAGPDVRNAIVAALSATSPLKPVTQVALATDPAGFGMAIMSDLGAAAAWYVVAEAATMCLTQAHVQLLLAVKAYYIALPQDRKGTGLSGLSSSTCNHESYADKLKRHGQPVPPATKPADDTVTGETKNAMADPNQRKAYLEGERKRIAERLGVPPEDVIILDEGDIPS